MVKVETLSVGKMKSNCYILYNAETLKTVIIDPGAEGDTIIARIEKLGICPEHIILTHGHFDHISAVDEICEKYNIGIIMNEQDAEMLSNANYNLSLSFDGTPVTVNCKNIKYVTDESKQLIGKKFEFIATPGHSNGSMCIKVCEYIFTGDTLFRMSIGNEFPPFGNFKTEINSIKDKLFALDGDYICLAGHGEKTTLDFERKYNRYIR